MKLNDLKIGNVVILRNGEMLTIRGDLKMGLACYWFNKNSVSFLYECRFDFLDDDLKHYRNTEFDVIEVYEDITIYFDETVKPIWTRSKSDEFKKGDLVWCKLNDGYILRSYYGYNGHKDKPYIAQPIRIYNDGERDYSGDKFNYNDIKPYDFLELGDIE